MVWPSILLFLLPSKWVFLAFSRYHVYSHLSLLKVTKSGPTFCNKINFFFLMCELLGLTSCQAPNIIIFYTSFSVSAVSSSFMWHASNTSMPWDTYPYVSWKTVNKTWGKTKLSFLTASRSYSAGQISVRSVKISNTTWKSPPLSFACPRAMGRKLYTKHLKGGYWLWMGERKALLDCNTPNVILTARSLRQGGPLSSFSCLRLDLAGKHDPAKCGS